MRSNSGIICVFVSTILFLFFAFIFAAAYSDYGFRDCPGAQQCEDAVDTMFIAGSVMVLSVFAFGAALFFNSNRKRLS
jgi:hypothetical protein